MLIVIRKSRVVRWIAFLAITLMVGIGPHIHAAKADAALSVALQIDAGEHESPMTAESLHCGFCHFARGVLPKVGTLGLPRLIDQSVTSATSARIMSALYLDVPSPPPRPARIA